MTMDLNQPSGSIPAMQTPTFTDFNSVIITVDHLTARQDQHVAQKFVMSTEDTNETMLALFKYYKEEAILANKATLEQFQMASASDFPAFVYRTPENIQIVLDMDTFQVLVGQFGSLLGATATILNTAAQAMLTADKERGDVVPLCLCCFEMQKVEDPAQAPEESASTGDTRPDLAGDTQTDPAFATVTNGPGTFTTSE